MKLTDAILDRLEFRVREYMEKGWTVEKPLYVDWLCRYAIKLRKPTADSIKYAVEMRDLRQSLHRIANQFGSGHADPMA